MLTFLHSNLDEAMSLKSVKYERVVLIFNTLRISHSAQEYLLVFRFLRPARIGISFVPSSTKEIGNHRDGFTSIPVPPFFIVINI